MPKRNKKRTKRVKKTRDRPPRIFVRKGKLYVRVGKKNILLKDQDRYTKRELMDIVLRDLVVRRKRRKKGKVTKRERRLDKQDLKTFEEFEKLNRNQSKVLKLPKNFKQKTDGLQNFFTALLKAFRTLPKDVNIETRETEKKKVQDEKVSTALVKAKPGKIKIKPSSTSTSAIGSSFTVTRPLLTPTTSSVIPSSVVTTPRSPEKKKKPIVLRSNAEKALRDRIKEIGFAKAKKDFVQMYKNTTGEEIKLKSKDALVSRVVDFYETELGDLGKIQEDLNSGDLFTLPSDGPPELEDERESVVMESDDEQEFFDPPSASKTAQDAVLKQIADGDYYTGNGLSTSEINKMMKPFGSVYLGALPLDFMSHINLKKLPKKFGFVMNLDKSNKPGSHWVSVYVDIKEDMSIEYYDSFARDPPAEFMKQIKKLIDKLGVNVYLKLKINNVIEQNSKTSNCGWFAMNFLSSRFQGDSYKEATKYDKSKDGERKIETLKKKFGYI